MLGPSGKRVSVTDNTGATTTYAYDGDGRLTEETSAAVGDVQYAYDPVGNRMSKTVNGVVVQSFSYDANDRVIQEAVSGSQYLYDADGNLGYDGVHKNQWDWDGRLTGDLAYATGVSASYLYTADGLRVQQNVLTIPTKFTSATTTTTNYTLDPDSGFGDVIEERDASGNLNVRYDYGDDMVRLDRSSGEYYYLYDGLGSVRNLTDASGNTIDSDSYDAFGNLLTGSNTTGLSSFLYDGQQMDPTGLYYLRARYMDPTRGEFESQDPFGGIDEEPMSLQRYLYASDDGINRIDPGGMLNYVADLGSAIHDVISDDFVSKGPDRYGDETTIAQLLGINRIPNLTLYKPDLSDVHNPSDKFMYEIKPFNYFGFVEGWAQLDLYISTMNSLCSGVICPGPGGGSPTWRRGAGEYAYVNPATNLPIIDNLPYPFDNAVIVVLPPVTGIVPYIRLDKRSNDYEEEFMWATSLLGQYDGLAEAGEDDSVLVEAEASENLLMQAAPVMQNIVFNTGGAYAADAGGVTVGEAITAVVAQGMNTIFVTEVGEDALAIAI